MPAICVFAPVTLLTITIEATGDGTDELHVHAGGQGVWIARMAVNLGAGATLCTPLGGETGRVVLRLLEEEGIEVAAVEGAGPTASWIQDRRAGERELVWESVPAPLGRHEIDELYSSTLAASLGAGVCAVAGAHEVDSILSDETYHRLAADLRAADVHVVSDVTGGQLSAVASGGVSVAKVSGDDLVRDGLATGTSEDELVAAARGLVEAGCSSVVVSRAVEGAIALAGSTLTVATPPALEAFDTRGAGDSMTAALAVAAARGLDWGDALRLAAAAGAVNVTRHGSGSGRLETIEALAERVELEVRELQEERP